LTAHAECDSSRLIDRSAAGDLQKESFRVTRNTLRGGGSCGSQEYILNQVLGDFSAVQSTKLMP
jgi:hypothetical protein